MTAGFIPTDFAAARELPLAQQHDAFCAHELDAIVYMVRHPNGLVDHVIRTCDGVLVDVSGPRIERLHPHFATLVPHDMVPGSTEVGVHAGAARYYRERGWLPR